MKTTFFFTLASLLALLSFGPSAATEPPRAGSTEAHAAITRFAQSESVFIENRGQWDASEILFALDSMGANVGFSEGSVKFQLFRSVSGAEGADRGNKSPDAEFARMNEATGASSVEMLPFSLCFEHARTVAPIGRNLAPARFNYTVGPPEQHRIDVPAYDAVWYEGLYPGVDLELTGSRTGVKYNFHVAPGADPRVIRLRYEGVKGIALREDGALEINLKDGWRPIHEGAPYIYQERAGIKHAVEGRFRPIDNHSFGFEIGAYDPALPLVIDPEVAWSSYLGDTLKDFATAVVVDDNANVYITGETRSSSWISGAPTGYEDAFVVKLDAWGDHVWSTYLGGAYKDTGADLALATDGSIYVVGETWSTGWISGGWITTAGDNGDGFLVKLNSNGNHLWSTFLGGTSTDGLSGVAVHSDGSVYVAGWSVSDGWGVVGGWQPMRSGGADGLVAKFNAAGLHQWSTYVGGSTVDQCVAIALDDSGNGYIAGHTISDSWIDASPWQATRGGGRDGFVMKFNAAGEDLWATYVGGMSTEECTSIAVDSMGNTYVVGFSYSDGWISNGTWIVSHQGNEEGFLVKLNTTGAHQWSTFLGGTGYDSAKGVVLDGADNVYVTGYTGSNNWVNGGWDFRPLTNASAFVAKLDANGLHQWSSYLGGDEFDTGDGIAADGQGNVYVVGKTNSEGWTVDGWDDSYGGNEDGFVAKISGVDDVGDLTVVLLPDRGAHWRLRNHSNWHESGHTITDLAAGVWEIEFSPLAGLNLPRNGIVVVVPDEVTVFTCVYYEGIDWSTYIGGTSLEYAHDIIVDSSSNVYVVGESYSSGWVSSGWDTTYGGATDGYVVKLDADGGHVWSTYLGGANYDAAAGVTLDDAGNLYVVGATMSSGWATGNSYFAMADGFIVKLNSQGAHQWSKYLGWNENDSALSVALDSLGNIYVSGWTQSPNQADQDAWIDTHQGGRDGFATKLDTSGSVLWFTYLGGANDDSATDIAVNSAANIVYVVGSTSAAGWVEDGYDTSFGGGTDGFVAAFSLAGGHQWSTYLGGTENDLADAIALSDDGDLYITGQTASEDWVSGGWDVAFNGDADGFVVKLYEDGAYGWSSYFGGASVDYGKGIAVDSSGNIVITGWTWSGGWVNGGWNIDFSNAIDAFVVKLDMDGAHVWSSYLGGPGNDGGQAVAVSGASNIYVAGTTASDGWVSGGWDTTYGGGVDAFAAKIIRTDAVGELTITLLPLAAVNLGGQWRRYGTQTWFNSGATETNVPAGTWRLEFSDVIGRVTPQGIVEVAHDHNTQASFIYAIKEGVNWSTYLGGAGNEFGKNVAVDDKGNVFVTGSTWSTGWVSDGEDETHNGDEDVFVAKFRADGIHLWSTYLGGANNEVGNAVDVDGNGAVYVVGNTFSPGWVDGPDDNAHGGSNEGFLAKIDAEGAILWSTYIGGTDADAANGVSVSAYKTDYRVYVVGATRSSDWIPRASINGGIDGFLVVFDGDGDRLSSRYLGGSADDLCSDVVVGGDGDIHISGQTQSSDWLPPGGWQASLQGAWDGFILKLDSDRAPLWGTYVGGANNDWINSIDVDTNGNVFVAIYSNANALALSFTVTGGHRWAVPMGGSNTDEAKGVAVDEDGNVYVVGDTWSSGWTSEGWDETYNGGSDAFVVKLDNDGGLLWSSYIGGADHDHAVAVAASQDGSVYIVGTTESTGWADGGWIPAHAGASDAFLMRVIYPNPPAPINPGADLIETHAITWTWEDTSVEGDIITGFKLYADPGVTAPVTRYDDLLWKKAESWRYGDGLSSNTQYAFQVAATCQLRNRDSQKTNLITRYTRSGPPAAGLAPGLNNIIADVSGTSVTFSNPVGFGEGAHGADDLLLVSGFRYAWDTASEYIFSGEEEIWSAGDFPVDWPTNDHYLHIESYNGDGLSGGAVAFGLLRIGQEIPIPAEATDDNPVMTINDVAINTATAINDPDLQKLIFWTGYGTGPGSVNKLYAKNHGLLRIQWRGEGIAANPQYFIILEEGVHTPMPVYHTHNSAGGNTPAPRIELKSVGQLIVHPNDFVGEGNVHQDGAWAMEQIGVGLVLCARGDTWLGVVELRTNTHFIGVQVIELRPYTPDIQDKHYIGQRLWPVAQISEGYHAFPHVARGMPQSIQPHADNHIYLHYSEGAATHGAVYGVKETLNAEYLDAEVFWMRTSDAAPAVRNLGISWPYEMARYQFEWPYTAHDKYQLYVRAKNRNLDEPNVAFPSQGFAATLMPYRLFQSGHNATLVSTTLGFTTSGPGWALLKYNWSQPFEVDFQVVRSVWNDEDGESLMDDYFSHPDNPVEFGSLAESPAPIGTEILDEYHERPAYAPKLPGIVHVRPAAPGEELEDRYDWFAYNGWTGQGDPPVVKPATATGQVIPVNTGKLEVWWYRLGIQGIAFPCLTRRYNNVWAEDALITIANQRGSEYIDSAVYKEFEIYYQNDDARRGYNPNDEHALIHYTLNEKMEKDTTTRAIFALRSDLGKPDTSLPYVLMRYQEQTGSQLEAYRYRVFKVEQGELTYDDCTAGVPVNMVYPLRDLFEYLPQNYGVSGPYWEDRNGIHWARSAGNDGGTAEIVMRHYYQVLPEKGFWSPYEALADGQILPWLSRTSGNNTDPENVTYIIYWPDAPEMKYVDTLVKARRGLPAIKGQQSVEIIYQQAQALGTGRSVHLIDFERYRTVNLGSGFVMPQDIRTETDLGGVLRFTDLSPALKLRLDYDPMNRTLRLKGYLVEPAAQDYYVLLNVLTEPERDEMLTLSSASAWVNAVNALYNEAKDLIQVHNSSMDFVELAVTTGYATAPGYVTLAMQNNQEVTSPVSLEIIRVVDDLHPGQIAVITPKCPFDERVTVKHNGDFAGQPGEYFFQWRRFPDATGTPPDMPPSEWTQFLTDPVDGKGVESVIIDEKRGLIALTDNWFITRYARVPLSGEAPEFDSADWSDWTEPTIVEGWIKRVVGEINPFTQRASGGGIEGVENNFFDHKEVNTIVSMISQAGRRWDGNVPLNCLNLDDFGLIEVYETVLGRGQQLSIDSNPRINYPPANNALLLAAGRISDLYMLLGNEAFADAADPTIAFGTDDGEYGAMASAIHCFMNITPSLIEEELALLRGQDPSRGMPLISTSPIYNRLIWNFTRDITGGEVAYALNYNIQDSQGNADGTINEYDAAILYPQGHGDAWGHYLSAIKRYYALLRHPFFSWDPRAEAVTVGGASVTVDYLDERKFAQAAAARARTGTDIVSLTYRRNYTENPEQQWQGYQDSNAERAWGVSDWAARAGMGAYFDWVVGNAIIPAIDEENEGVQKIDRTTVPELRDIAAAYPNIEAELEKADLGLNPLGLATNVLPFDIGPIAIDNQKTHFEQIYDRAVGVMNNTITVFNHAQNCTQLLRRQANNQGEFSQHVAERENDYKNRLIEIFGYPYSDDIGGGKTYPQGYDGPDLYHFAYVDASELMGVTPPPVQPFAVQVTDFLEINPDGTTVETTKNITFHLSTTGLGLVKPPGWTGTRRAPGELQLARSDLLQARARFERTLTEYGHLIQDIEYQLEAIEAQFDVQAEEIAIINGATQQKEEMDVAIQRSRTQQLAYQNEIQMLITVANAVSEGMPSVMGTIAGVAAGVIGDFTSSIRSGIQTAAASAAQMLNNLLESDAHAELDHEQAKEQTEQQTQIALLSLEHQAVIGEHLLVLEQLVKSEAILRLDLYTQQEAMQQSSGRYLETLARGQRLLEERTRFRVKTAGQVQEYRYKDMAFRIFRNEALQQYRAQFDLAARYVYLAAKVYDYETNLLRTDSQAGQRYLNSIVRTRAIGGMAGGQPQVTTQGDTGLATPLRQMRDNFNVMAPQFGFNNPQTETNRFGLRGELFRVLPGPDGDQAWRDTLEQHVVADILTMPEFKRYCIPFTPTQATEPAIVIPFSSNINFGQNFFGWPLSGGDSAYDSTNFVTKIRSIGIWFSNYNNLGGGMSNTPRVYLIPVGTDMMRSPTDDSRTALREWTILDQRMPVPFNIGPGDLNNPSWMPMSETLGGNFAAIRRYNSFRAYHDSGSFNPNETQSTDSRLIGRSVWNSQWLLIIPAGTLHSDRQEGLLRFIHGPLVGSERTGQGVSDIKIFFQTYAYSGVKDADDSNAVVEIVMNPSDE